MRKILVSIVTILMVSVLAFTATRAVWSDTGTSTGNTFQAGILDLKLSDSNETDQDSVTATWNASLMTPGGSGATGTLNIKNVGNPSADHIHLQFVNSITPGSGAGSTETDLITKHLQVTSMTYDGVDMLSTIPDSNVNGYKDLADLEGAGTIGANTGVTPASLELTNLNTNHPLIMTVALNSDSPDQNQGDSVATVVTVTLHQTDGQ